MMGILLKRSGAEVQQNISNLRLNRAKLIDFYWIIVKI